MESPDDTLRFDPEDLAPGIKSADELPAKLYFRIGEVSKLTGLKQHVLRYWETEFPNISPKKMGSNHRMYRRKDVEFILEVKHLLYEKRYTIEGARKHLEHKPKPLSKSAKKNTAAAGAGRPMPKVQSSLFLVNEIEKKPEPSPAPRTKFSDELRAILEILQN
ncbi:MerR family transcriptional regulator [Bryobacter aggregatus]|uniref:MerR family transcriptional regulator n=1 Tax=Bryobacter aggregatus TaxID=360054 RepID=UPI00192E4FFC|nr:MerR family transcriptional regulator [Bryobacter aggregatus]